VLELQKVSKTYTVRGRTASAISELDFTVNRGDLLVIWGPSGSGKSTLLLTMGGMLAPDQGSVLFNNQDVYKWSAARRNRFRRAEVGFVFQRFFLVPHLNVRDNIRMPAAFKPGCGNVDARVQELAERLQIDHRLDHRPAQLSVGEQQRVAIARGLVCPNALILADEPTGNLDDHNIELIVNCFLEEHRAGRTLAIVTHDRALLDIAPRQLHLHEGALVKQQ